jgi:hypothetical protein
VSVELEKMKRLISEKTAPVLDDYKNISKVENVPKYDNMRMNSSQHANPVSMPTNKLDNVGTINNKPTGKKAAPTSHQGHNHTLNLAFDENYDQVPHTPQKRQLDHPMMRSPEHRKPFAGLFEVS